MPRNKNQHESKLTQPRKSTISLRITVPECVAYEMRLKAGLWLHWDKIDDNEMSIKVKRRQRRDGDAKFGTK